MTALLIIFSSKRTIVEETSKFSVTSKTLKDADKRETNEKKVMYVRNHFEKFVQGSRMTGTGRKEGEHPRYKLGLWASTTKKNTDKCVQVLEEQFQLTPGSLFRFILDRQHCSDSQGNPIGRDNLFAGSVIKDLQVIWKSSGYGPENTILVTSSINEAILQPRNVIYLPDFDSSRKLVDNALARLHLLIEAWSNPDDPNSVTDARDLCDRISRMPGFGFSQSILMNPTNVMEFVNQASSKLLGKLLSRERFEELGLIVNGEEREYQNLVFPDRVDDHREKYVRNLIENMRTNPDLMHIMRYFVFNVGYLTFLKANSGLSMPEVAKLSLDANDKRISITYTRRVELGQTLTLTTTTSTTTAT